MKKEIKVRHGLMVIILCLSMLSMTACANVSVNMKNDGLAKQLTFICPQSAGGETDVNIRLLAKYLESELGSNIICQNVPGGNGSIAMNEYKDNKPDNATFILTNTASMSGNYATGIADFCYEVYDPVAIFGLSSGEVILVPKDAPYQTLEELIEATKANPGEIIYGGPTGGASYLACYLALNKEYGADFGFVEAGDGAERLAFLLGGHIDVCNSALLTCKEYIDSGELRPLASLLSEAPDSYPDIRTACTDYPKMIQDTYYVMLALKGTDPAIIEKMNEAVTNVVTSNEDYKTEYYEMNLQNPMCLSVEDTIAKLEEQKDHFVDLAQLMDK